MNIVAEKFSTGKPCKRGHITDRLVSSGACCECQREINRVRYLSDTKNIRARITAYRLRNLEKVKAAQRAARSNKIEEYRAKDRLRNSDPKRRAAGTARLAAWNAAHPERAKSRISEWAKSNPDKVCAKFARYRAAKMQQMPKWADHSAIDMIYRAAEVIRTTGFDVHVDHAVPLQGKIVSGLHVHTNLQIIAAQANRSKSNRFSERISK